MISSSADPQRFVNAMRFVRQRPRKAWARHAARLRPRPL